MNQQKFQTTNHQYQINSAAGGTKIQNSKPVFRALDFVRGPPQNAGFHVLIFYINVFNKAKKAKIQHIEYQLRKLILSPLL